MKKHLLFASLALFASTPLLASGLSKPVNVGPKAIGMGGAFVGIADDVTAIYHNPAGISQLKGHNFFLGADTLITDLDYTPTGGAKEKLDRQFIPVPSFGYVTDVLKPITLGLGVFFPHGNGGKFGSPSANILNPDEGRIYSMEISPTASWQIIDGLSLGASLRIVRASVNLKNQLVVLSASPLVTDTVDELDVSGWGLAAAVGAFYRPWKEISFGVNWRQKFDKTLEGDVDLATAGEFDATLDQTLPTQINGGIGLYPLDALQIGLGYSFERNSEIDSFDATIETSPTATPVSFPQQWKDSHTVHVGAEYWVCPSFAVRGGYAVDLNASIPDNAINRITADIAAQETSAGVAYKWHNYQVGATWNARFGERSVPNTGANPGHGKYEAFVQAVSLGVSASL